MLSDTHPKITRIQIEILRRMPPWQKIALLSSLNETVQTLAIAGIKQRHPHATPEQIQRIWAEMTLGAELANKVYGHAE